MASGPSANNTKESSLFIEVNATFGHVMSNAAEQPNAVIQCTATGMLETVTCMDDKLETIQKSLDSFPTYPFLTQGN